MMYCLLLFILPFWLRLFLSLAHISIWLCCCLNESFCTLISDHCISNFDHVKVFHFGWFYSLFSILWWSAIAAVHAICCTWEILTPFHLFPLQEACSPVAEKTISWFRFGVVCRQSCLSNWVEASLCAFVCVRMCGSLAVALAFV